MNINLHERGWDSLRWYKITDVVIHTAMNVFLAVPPQCFTLIFRYSRLLLESFFHSSVPLSFSIPFTLVSIPSSAIPSMKPGSLLDSEFHIISLYYITRSMPFRSPILLSSRPHHHCQFLQRLLLRQWSPP